MKDLTEKELRKGGSIERKTERHYLRLVYKVNQWQVYGYFRGGIDKVIFYTTNFNTATKLVNCLTKQQFEMLATKS